VLQVPIDELADFALDERRRGGEDPGQISRSARQEMDVWLAARGNGSKGSLRKTSKTSRFTVPTALEAGWKRSLACVVGSDAREQLSGHECSSYP
jgi:hypothetical protein